MSLSEKRLKYKKHAIKKEPTRLNVRGRGVGINVHLQSKRQPAAIFIMNVGPMVLRRHLSITLPLQPAALFEANVGPWLCVITFR